MEKDIKNYLLMSSKKWIRLLKISPRLYFLPSITLYPSSYCNYNCVMCRNAIKNELNKDIMPLFDLKRILNECSKFIIKPLVHFSGVGEPLVYKDIGTVMEICKAKKLKCSMTTNGFLL